MKRTLLLAVSMTVDGLVFAGTVVVISAWVFGLLPAIMGVPR